MTPYHIFGVVQDPDVRPLEYKAIPTIALPRHVHRQAIPNPSPKKGRDRHDKTSSKQTIPHPNALTRNPSITLALEKMNATPIFGVRSKTCQASNWRHLISLTLVNPWVTLAKTLALEKMMMNIFGVRSMTCQAWLMRHLISLNTYATPAPINVYLTYFD